MPHLSRSPLALLSLALLTIGCTESARRGGAGESCTSSRDCASELACVAQTCVALGDAAIAPVGSGSPAGAGCATRRDCAPGLICSTNVCQAMTIGQTQVDSRLGGRGESCRAKNDCIAPLGCIDNTCQLLDTPINHAAKSCHRVECAKREDCCADFEPNEKCDVYKENCATDPVFCNTYRALCECSKDCVQELCVAQPPGCMADAECTSRQTPYCVSGKCRECNGQQGCSEDERCVEGQCLGACEADEQCPALNRCVQGICTASGCQSQRECAFLTKDSRALCKSGKCQVPCEVDRDCHPPAGDETKDDETSFKVCRQGECVFVGCENNAECRALLRIENEEGLARAVCR